MPVVFLEIPCVASPPATFRTCCFSALSSALRISDWMYSSSYFSSLSWNLGSFLCFIKSRSTFRIGPCWNNSFENGFMQSTSLCDLVRENATYAAMAAVLPLRSSSSLLWPRTMFANETKMPLCSVKPCLELMVALSPVVSGNCFRLMSFVALAPPLVLP